MHFAENRQSSNISIAFCMEMWYFISLLLDNHKMLWYNPSRKAIRGSLLIRSSLPIHLPEVHMSDRDIKLTDSQIEAIETVLNGGNRVEVIPLKDGVKIVRQRREEVKVSNRLKRVGF